MGVDGLPARWRTQAAEYLRIAKAYNCASNAKVREGYVKGAAILRECARELEEAMAADRSGAPAFTRPGSDGET